MKSYSRVKPVNLPAAHQPGIGCRSLPWTRHWWSIATPRMLWRVSENARMALNGGWVILGDISHAAMRPG